MLIQHPDGELLQIDGLANSVSSPGKVDLIEAKFGYVTDIERSKHLVFGDRKIYQMERLANFARVNPDEGRARHRGGKQPHGRRSRNPRCRRGLQRFSRGAATEARALVEVVNEDFTPLARTK